MDAMRQNHEVPASAAWLRENMEFDDSPPHSAFVSSDVVGIVDAESEERHELLESLKNRIGGELPPALPLDHLLALDNSLRKLDDSGPTGLAKEETAVLFLTEKTAEIAKGHGIESPPQSELKDLHTLFLEGAERREREQQEFLAALLKREFEQKQQEQQIQDMEAARAKQSEKDEKAAAAFAAQIAAEEARRRKAMQEDLEAERSNPDRIKAREASEEARFKQDMKHAAEKQAKKELKEQERIQTKMSDPRYKVAAHAGRYYLREASDAEMLVDRLDKQIEEERHGRSLASRTGTDGTVTLRGLTLASELFGRPNILDDMVRDKLRQKRENEEIQSAILTARREATRMEPRRFAAYAEELKVGLQQVFKEAAANGWSDERLMSEKRQVRHDLSNRHVRQDDRPPTPRTPDDPNRMWN